jgi:hypothetical protein
MGLGAGCKRSHLFVAHVNPLYFVLAANRVYGAVETVANDPVNPFHAGRDQRFGKLICHCLHDLLLCT